MLMNDVIVIKDLNFKYNDKFVLEHLDLTIKNNSWVTILGPSGSGKTTLLKVIAGKLESDAYISIDGTLNLKENREYNQSKIGYLFEKENPVFLFDTVYDELSYKLECLDYTDEDIYEVISSLFSSLEISYTLNENPNMLSFGNKQLLSILKEIINPPKIIVIDNVISTLSERYRKNILNYLKYLKDEKKITIIHSTVNPEDTIESDYIGILSEGKIFAYGKRDEIYNNFEIWKKLDMSLPFMVELSTKLKYYDLVDDVIMDMDEMVDKLWN